MNKVRILLAATVCLCVAGLCRPLTSEAHSQATDGATASSPPVVAGPDDIWRRETLGGGFATLGDKLADAGIEIGLGMTNIYQANVRGGLSTHHRQGRHTGSYDVEISSDLQKLLGIEGALLYVHTEGSWSRTDIDATSVGSVFGTNADAGG